MVRFEKALMLSKALRQNLQERRATRGLAAAARLQGQYKTAIGHLERVLQISRDMQEYTGERQQQGPSPGAACHRCVHVAAPASRWHVVQAEEAAVVRGRARDGRAHKVNVTLAARGSRDAVLVGGLAENDRVVLYPSTTLADGSRVESAN